MEKLIRPENSKTFIILIATVSWFALLAHAQAVSPPPDGGYPGGNTAEGQNALFSLTTGSFNTAVGYVSLRSGTTGSYNTAVGAGALLGNTADENTASGFGALLSNTTGVSNTANGALVLFSNTTGAGNTATGLNALFSNTAGSVNTAMGDDALFNNTTGNNNIALGFNAGFNLTTGDNNIDIGYNVVGVAGESHSIRIGNADITDTFIRGISGATASGGAAVFVNGNGKLGTMTSSARFKDEIKPMDKASEAILALKPVTFRYKKGIDPQQIAQFGLVAEEVEKVNPNLVIRDAAGRPQTVRYEQINAMLLNEFLKEHRKVEAQARKMVAQEHKIGEQEAMISELKEDLQIVVARLKDQESKIQSVSAELEIVKRLPQVVATNP
jgi:hypothetical protein